MATYTVQAPATTGTTPTFTAVSASDTFTPSNGGVHFLYVKNAGGSSDTVVVDDPNSTLEGAASFNPDLSVSVPNAQERIIRIDPARFKNASTGLITVTHSFTTSVTAAVFRGGQ